MARVFSTQPETVRWRRYIYRRSDRLHGEPDQCYLCCLWIRRHGADGYEVAELDHVFVPRSRGGSDAPWNRAWICRPCNVLRYERPLLDFLDYVADVDATIRAGRGRRYLALNRMDEPFPLCFTERIAEIRQRHIDGDLRPILERPRGPSPDRA